MIEMIEILEEIEILDKMIVISIKIGIMIYMTNQRNNKGLLCK